MQLPYWDFAGLVVVGCCCYCCIFVVFFFPDVVFRGVYEINNKLPRTSALCSRLLMLPKLICFHLCVPCPH